MKDTNVPKGYYASAHWKAFTKATLAPNDTVCEICGCNRWKVTRAGEKRINRRFSVHHKNYKHLWKETPADVMIVCSRCHNLMHDILRMKTTTDIIEELQTVVRKYFTYEHS